MKAAYFVAPHKIKIRNESISSPKDSEVLVEVKACGICGTDLHIYQGHVKGLVSPPLVLGHEFSGVVKSVGKSVNSLKIGDHVAIEPNMFCGQCSYCRTARKHFCKSWKTVGLAVNGGFEEFVCVEESTCYKMDDKIPFHISAFFEPLSCILHGLERSEVKFGDVVALQGLGGIGQVFCQCLALSGVSKIIVIDIVDSKLDVARKLCSHLPVDIVSINPSVFLKKDSLEDEIISHTKDIDGVDVFIDCSGIIRAIPIGLKVIKNGGRILVFGVATEGKGIEISPYDIYRKEAKIIGSFTQPYSNVSAMDILKKLKLEELITKIKLEDIEAGFKMMGKEGYFKIQVIFE